MTHAKILQTAAALVADAETRHPADRVKQCIHIVTRPNATADAFAKSITDIAFDAVFRYASDEEAQVWAIWCLYDDVKPMADARMTHRVVKLPTMQVAA